MKLAELENKKILILGFGKEGRATFQFLRKVFPHKVLAVGDRNEKVKNLLRPKLKGEKVRWYLGKNYLRALKNYDLIIKSPGIGPKVVSPFLNKKQKLTSLTEIFFENCPGKIIGITGTKGKGTTSLLIYRILKEGGLPVHLVGNIGKPGLNFLFSAKEKDIFVYELSSHQLFNLRKSPKIAVLLNIFPAHLDYFPNFGEYLKSKERIVRYQKENDYLVYDSKNKICREIAKISKAKKIPIARNYHRFFKPKKERGFFAKKIPLIGKFNLKNIMAAIEVAKIFKIKNEKILEAIKNFKNQPHRLEDLGTFKGIRFYNDSASTIPESTISAIEALKGKVQTLILGGSENGRQFKELAKIILKNKIKNLIFFPTTGQKIWQEIIKIDRLKAGHRPLGWTAEKLRYFFVESMAKAVKLAFQYTKKGKVCLLSPASPSFSLFRDYRERGNLFKRYVKKLAKKQQ